MPVTQAATTTLTITIESPLTITTTSLSNAIQGQAYSQQLQASGGVPPYTWSVAADSPSPLPAGLTLSAAGLLSGTPTANGSFSVKFAVTDTGA